MKGLAIGRNIERNYNKIILMACTLHVPINISDENENENNGENPVNIVEIESNNNKTLDSESVEKI